MIKEQKALSMQREMLQPFSFRKYSSAVMLDIKTKQNFSLTLCLVHLLCQWVSWIPCSGLIVPQLHIIMDLWKASQDVNVLPDLLRYQGFSF